MKKTLKIAALTVALALIAGLLYLAVGLLGNPVSKMLAKRGAEAYLEETYADTDFQLEEVCYDFKMNGYYARVVSPSSPDFAFSLSMDWLGHVTDDYYEREVLSGNNTARRLDQEYRELVDHALEAADTPYPSDLCFGELWGIQREMTLELDRVYDIRALGREYGGIVFYYESETVTPEKAAEVLLGLRRYLDEAGVPFRTIDFTLQSPKPEDIDAPWDPESVQVEKFPYEEITEENLPERIAAADAALREQYEEMDAEKNNLVN